MSDNATPSKYLRQIRKGEYDLVNISLIGGDPSDGRSYDECHAEWSAAFDAVQKERAGTRWWQLRRHFRTRLKVVALASHLGAMG